MLTVETRVNGEGRRNIPSFAVGQRVIDWSRLGFILADAPKLERNFEIVNVDDRAIDETWEQPWGERRFVRNHCNRAARDTAREDRRRGAIWSWCSACSTTAWASATNFRSRRH